MADKEPSEPLANSSSSPSSSSVPSSSEGRFRREPPTIDLARSDIVSDRVDAAGEAASQADPADATDATSPEIPSTEPPSKSEAASGKRGGLSPALTGAVSAAAVVGVAALAAWAAGWPQQPQPAPQQAASAALDRAALDALGSRLSSLEADVRTVRAATPVSNGSDAAAIGEALTRLGATEQGIAALREQLSAQKAANDEMSGVLSAIRSDLGALQSAAIATPSAAGSGSAPDLSAIETRIAEVARVAQAASAQAASAKAAVPGPAQQPDDTALRRALVALQLGQSVPRGEPYGDLLASAKSLAGADVAALAPLDAFAATGVPRDDALLRELRELVQPLMQARAASGNASDTGLMDRLQASASRLVHIRREGPVAGADVAAVASRIADAAKRGDLAAAKTAIAELPARERAVIAGWSARVVARDAALAAVRVFSASAAAAVSTHARQAQ